MLCLCALLLYINSTPVVVPVVVSFTPVVQAEQSATPQVSLKATPRPFSGWVPHVARI